MKTVVLDPGELAKRLDVAPERLYFSVHQKGNIVIVESFIDGKDLDDTQKAVVTEFISEFGAIKSAYVTDNPRVLDLLRATTGTS